MQLQEFDSATMAGYRKIQLDAVNRVYRELTSKWVDPRAIS